jgi:hypothetical protein
LDGRNFRGRRLATGPVDVHDLLPEKNIELNIIDHSIDKRGESFL